MLRSMIFIADSAMVPFFSLSSESRMAFCTSSGISADVRRINSIRESCSAFIRVNRKVCRCGCQRGRSRARMQVLDIISRDKNQKRHPRQSSSSSSSSKSLETDGARLPAARPCTFPSPVTPKSVTSGIAMSERTVPRLPKWPFFLGDILLVTLAYLILGAAYAHGKWPMNTWQNLWCVLSLSLGCVLGVLPFLLEYRAAMKLTEADRLTNAVLQIENLEIIGRQITNATANWQTAHEHSIQAVETAREIAEGITAEARAFSEFLQKANDTEKNHLRLEVDKLRRAENEWLQVLVRLLDHVFALYQAALRSGQGNLTEQLGLFQDSCRDVARRVGLVPFT